MSNQLRIKDLAISENHCDSIINEDIGTHTRHRPVTDSRGSSISASEFLVPTTDAITVIASTNEVGTNTSSRSPVVVVM